MIHSSSRFTRALSSAALVAAPLFTVLHATPAFAGPDPRAASPAEVKAATAHFTKGADLFKGNRFAPALEEFKQSYASVPSPNSHLYIARCLAGLGQTRAAWLEYDRTAAEAASGPAKYAQTRDTAIQERDDLSTKLALVAVVVQGADSSASVRVGPYEVPGDRIGQPFPLEPGSFDVVLNVPGRGPTVQSITVRAGERRDVIIAPSSGGPANGPVVTNSDTGSSPSKLNGLRVGAIIAGAVGVAGFIMFAVEGSASKSTYNTISAACGGVQGCPSQTGAGRASINSQISSGKTEQTIANVGLGLGIVGIAAGATLLAVSFRRQPSDAGRPNAQLVVGPSWLGARGSF